MHHHPIRSTLAHAAVIGGSPAASGAFPSLALIEGAQEEEGIQCTGTVVAPRLILTAAHCAENPETGVLDEPGGYAVVTGNVEWTASPRQVLAVSQVIVYPGFAPSVLDGDAALLVLATPTTAPSIPLWTAGNAGTLQPGRAANIVGWGQEYFEQEAVPDRLKWAETAIQSPEWCAHHAPNFYEHGELCTIDPPSYSTGACHGDSGGPLLVSSPEGPVEVGITSHIYGECVTTNPTIFTRTDILVSWVQEWAEAEKPVPPITPPPAPTSKAPTPTPIRAAPARKTTSAPVVAPAKAPAPPPVEGVYRGATSQASTPISLVVGSGGRRVTAIATNIIYHCHSGHTIGVPLDGLSNGEIEPITARHTFTVKFSGAETETVTGAIDSADGGMSGTLVANWKTHHYGLCSTGHVSWTAQHSAPRPSTDALTPAGNYHGWTNQTGHIDVTVAASGRQLTDLEFSAVYACPRHHRVRMTESFLSPTEPWALESFGTFTVYLRGHHYGGRVDGAVGLVTNGAAFGTLQATARTRYGRCHTGVVPWET
ncbi:MAG: S1 family peptidase [Solirubrobacteraceae bacterium]